MNKAPSTPRASHRWPRLIAGALVLLASLGGLLMVLLTGLAEYRYGQIPPLPADANDKQDLTQYSLRLEGLLKLDPTNGEIMSKYASACGRLGDYDQAIECLKKAQLTHNTQSSLSFLADMYERKNAISEAEAVMADCVRINPNDPQFHPVRLRLLNKQLIALTRLRQQGQKVDDKLFLAVSRTYGEAAENWVIRAPHDKNSYLFLGQYQVALKNYLYAYRAYLVGLSQASWLWLNGKDLPMILPQNVHGTIKQIVNGHYAKPYKGLP